MTSRFSPRQIGSRARLIQPNFTPEKVTQAVQLVLSKNIAVYTTASSLPTIILELCNKVNAQDGIEELVEGLKDAQPNPTLHLALDAFVSMQATNDVCGLLVLRPLPRVAMVNRQTLRSHLEKLAS